MLEGLRQYTVQASARRPLIEFMTDSLSRVGCRHLFVSPPNRAPFVFTFETPDKERLGVVAYAFFANRTPTRGRPEDERSFQIKYGTPAQYGGENLHELWQDPYCLFTTMVVGIDTQERFFVSLDPKVHNPTKFFIRLEFKDLHAEKIADEGWHAWSRARRAAGRDEGYETLVGGTQENLLNLIRFEREATGLSAADRLRLARGWPWVSA